jgi:hypothetical protein
MLTKTVRQRVGVPPVVVQQNAGPLKRDAKARATQSKMQVAVTSLSLLSLLSLTLSLSLPPSACPFPLALFYFFEKNCRCPVNSLFISCGLAEALDLIHVC